MEDEEIHILQGISAPLQHPGEVIPVVLPGGEHADLAFQVHDMLEHVGALAYFYFIVLTWTFGAAQQLCERVHHEAVMQAADAEGLRADRRGLAELIGNVVRVPQKTVSGVQ